MKKILALALAILMVCTLTACDIFEVEEAENQLDEKPNAQVDKEPGKKPGNSDDENGDENNSKMENMDGLEFQLNDDKKGYTLVKIGACTAKNIVIDSYNGLPVTSIRSEAFFDCERLTSIVIGNNVTEIGSWAFYNCSSLKNVTIPSSVIKIGERAFANCRGLTNITIPDSIISIGEEAFFGCDHLNKTSYENATYLGNTENPYVYLWEAENENIDSVKIHEQTKVVGSYAFANCKSLKRVTIPDRVTEIGNSSFYGCEGITSITIGNNVAEIGRCAFTDCTSLTSISIGNGVRSIGDDGFKNCDNLRGTTYDNSIYFGNAENPYVYLWKAVDQKIDSVNIHERTRTIGGKAFAECDLLASITIPDGVVNIGYLAFFSCKFTSITIPDNVINIESHAFYGCTNLESITVEEGNTKYHSSGNCLIENKGKILIAGCKNSVIPTDGSVTSIYDHAFANCVRLTSITIPDSVTRIGYASFSYCTNLTSIVIPNSVKEIDSWAFGDCYGLTSITIPDSVTSIGDDAFNNCDNLIGTNYGNAIYLGNTENPYVYLWKASTKNVDSVNIHEKTRLIGYHAFTDCTALTTVTIPNGVVEIGDSAFLGCVGLTSLTLSDNVVKIGDSAFSKCSGIKSVTIPNNVIRIGYYAFNGCTELTNAIFEKKEGWRVGYRSISSEKLEDASTAAMYLISAAYSGEWTRS